MLANFIDEQCLCYRHYSEASYTVASNLEVMNTAVASTVALRDRTEKGNDYQGATFRACRNLFEFATNISNSLLLLKGQLFERNNQSIHKWVPP